MSAVPHLPAAAGTADRVLAADPRLLRGTGPGLGSLAERFGGDERTLLHVLRAQAEAFPDKDWLVFDSRDRLTFRVARDESHRVAAALVTRGFGGARVALLLRNQREFMPLFLGALTAGGVAAPMNPELRGRLLALLLQRADPQVLGIRTDLLARLDDLPSLEASDSSSPAARVRRRRRSTAFPSCGCPP